MRPPPLWHGEAKLLRASGIDPKIIADRLGKSATQVRWVLDEHGERDAARARTREIMQRDRQSARRATDKPEHKPRAQATRVDRETIDQAVRDFSDHLIDRATLMARITPENPPHQDLRHVPRASPPGRLRCVRPDAGRYAAFLPRVHSGRLPGVEGAAASGDAAAGAMARSGDERGAADRGDVGARRGRAWGGRVMGKLWLSPAETAVVNDLIEMFPAQWKQAILNPRLIGWFVGQVMLSSDGRFDANRVRMALVERGDIELFLHGEAVTP